MPPKKKKKSDSDKGIQKISAFFKAETPSDTGRKRTRSKQEDAAVPSPKRPLSDSSSSKSPLSSPPPSGSPPPSAAGDISPEQRERMKNNKLEAEAKIIAKKFGAEELGLTWVKALLLELKKPYMKELMEFVQSERAKRTVYPPAKDVFSWTTSCPISEVKVVIIGQDPYHGPNQAHGMCFSVRVGVTVPPSLQNMYKELRSDIEGFEAPRHGYLMGWAKQGVLLLNACLTVRHKEPNSHAGKGWEKLTDAVIHWLNDNRSGLVFLLWGSYAQKKGSFIDKKKHCVLKSAHPSPLSAHRGFMGNKHFSQANEYLKEKSKKMIDWSYLPEAVPV